MHFAQEQLHAAIVDVDHVLPHEHLVEDLLREVCIERFHAFDHHPFLRRRHEIQNLGGRLHAAHRRFLDVVGTGKKLRQHVVQLAQR